MKYEYIYEFLINGNALPMSRDSPAAFKSLDAFRMVCAEGWLSTLTIKDCPSTVVVKGFVKLSQRSGVLYETLVAVKHNGSVLCGHCTCMVGLSEVCNHIGLFSTNACKRHHRKSPQHHCKTSGCHLKRLF